MTLDESLEFFYRNGNVGRSIKELHKTKPTMNQLIDAFDAALSRGAERSEAEAAKTALISAGHVLDQVPQA